MRSGRLHSKVAMITGGASGIGAATAKKFRDEGAVVVLTDVQVDLGQGLADEIGATFFPLDVSCANAWAKVMDMTEAQFGRLDVMFNNAGIQGAFHSIGTITMEVWQHVIAVNQTGVMLGCQNAIRLMRKNRNGTGGSIINTASTASYFGVADDIAYCTSKAAISMLTKSVAVWCARENLNIRCNSIHPGAIRTAIYDQILKVTPHADQLLDSLSNISPLRRMGTAEEVAALVTFLASDEASWITAGDYVIDGGTIAPHPGT